MSFTLRNLSVLAYANGFTLWHYKAAQGGLHHAAQPGYFNDAADMLAPGDMMLLSAPEGGRVVCLSTGDRGISAAPLG